MIPPEKQFDLILKAHWTNSLDLAYCMINIALPKDEEYLFDDFTTYIKACRLADTGNGTKPKANERFDRSGLVLAPDGIQQDRAWRQG